MRVRITDIHPNSIYHDNPSVCLIGHECTVKIEGPSTLGQGWYRGLIDTQTGGRYRYLAGFKYEEIKEDTELRELDNILTDQDSAIKQAENITPEKEPIRYASYVDGDEIRFWLIDYELARTFISVIGHTYNQAHNIYLRILRNEIEDGLKPNDPDDLKHVVWDTGRTINTNLPITRYLYDPVSGRSQFYEDVGQEVEHTFTVEPGGINKPVDPPLIAVEDKHIPGKVSFHNWPFIPPKKPVKEASPESLAIQRALHKCERPDQFGVIHWPF